MGYVYVEDLQLGEYTPAVYDKTIVGVPENIDAKKVKFYPNQAKKKLNVEFAERGHYTIRFYNEKGWLLKELTVNGRHAVWRWEPYEVASGILVAEVINNGKSIATEKILILK